MVTITNYLYYSVGRYLFLNILSDGVLTNLPEQMRVQAEAIAALSGKLNELVGGTDSSNEPQVEDEDNSDDPFASFSHLISNDKHNDVTEIDNPIDPEIQAILNQTEDIPDYGADLSQATASSYVKIPNQNISKEKLDKLSEQYKPPNNCRILGVPKINSEIWNSLPKNVRVEDVKFQIVQQHMSRAMVAQARLLDFIINSKAPGSKEVSQSILQLVMDSSLSLGCAIKEINTIRKFKIRPSLHQQYAPLCSAGIPVTDKLFGDNLEQSLKQVKSVNNVVKTATTTTPRRYSPYVRPLFKRHQRLNFKTPPPARGGQGQNQPQFHMQRKPRPFQSKSPQSFQNQH